MISVHFGTLYCTLQVSYTFVPISVMPHYPPWPVQVKVGQGGDLTFNRANIMEQTLKISMQTEVGDYWGVDAYSVSMQNADNIVISNPQL